MPKAASLKKKLAPGRKKLAALGINLPLLPTTSVGSLPKPADLVELRYKVAKGVQGAAELERKEKLATEMWIREQERLGLDVLVDGELNRADLVSFFAKRLKGFEMAGTVRSYGNRYYNRPVIKEKVEWKGPMTVEGWRFAQRLTHRPLKAIITGPYTLMDWSFNEHYASREAACRDIAAAIRKEISALTEAGVKIIQIDEPALSARPDELSLVADGLKEIVGNSRCYFILHHCYGDLRGLWKPLQRLPVDNFDLETANSRFSLIPEMRKFSTDKDVSIGVVDSHSHVVETPAQLREEIRTALSAVPRDQLWISPDCGLKTRTTEEAAAKLRVMVTLAASCRNPVK